MADSDSGHVAIHCSSWAPGCLLSFPQSYSLTLQGGGVLWDSILYRKEAGSLLFQRLPSRSDLVGRPSHPRIRLDVTGHNLRCGGDPLSALP